MIKSIITHTHMYIKCSTNFVFLYGFLITFFLTPPDIFYCMIYCMCVCDALNPIDLQTCYQGQIVHQGKMELGGPSVEVDSSQPSPPCPAKFGSSS